MNNQIKIPREDLEKIRLIQLDMLKEVKRICEKNNIKYSIMAGTLLGSVRHKGYIPWDDDADFAMLRSEYEKFKVAVEKDLDKSKYYFQHSKNTYGYRWTYGKLRRKNTLFIRHGQEHLPYESGIFIDVFPFDNVPENIYERLIHNMCCNIVRKILWSEVGRKTEKNMLIKNIYKLLSNIPLKDAFYMYELLVKWSNSKDSRFVRILTFPTPSNGVYGYLKCWYKNLEDLVFENELFPAPKDFDSCLSMTFGDYLKYPPLKDRVGHPVSKYKLI